MDPNPQPRRWQRWLARFYHIRGRAHRRLGHLHGDREEYRRAVVDLTRAVELDPGFVQPLYDRALLLWRERFDNEQAIRDLTRVLQLDPDRAETWFMRGLARETGGDIEGSIADLERYLLEGEDPVWREISQEQIEALRSIPTAEERSER